MRHLWLATLSVPRLFVTNSGLTTSNTVWYYAILTHPSTLGASGSEVTQMPPLCRIAIIIGLGHASRSTSVRFESTGPIPVSSRHHDDYRL